MTPASASSILSTAMPTVAFDVAAVYRSHGAAVARWAQRLGGPAVDAEDVVQEVFMIVQRKSATFRGEASPARWLYRITERVVAHRRRKTENRWRRFLSGDADGAAEVAAPDATPLELVEQRETAARFYRALERMNENHRAAFILYEIEELPCAEIAALKNVQVATVWVWLHRARAHFVARLGQLDREAAR